MRLERFNLTLAVAGLAATLLASGCGGDDKPTSPDTLPPFVQWVTPSVAAAGDTLFVFEQDTTTVVFSAADDGGVVTALEIYLGGTRVATVTSAPWRARIDLSAIGVHRSARIHAVAYDPSGKSGSTADTLRFVRTPLPDTVTWSPLAPTGSPSAREGHTLVLDAANQRGLLFGGFSAFALTYFNDVWTYDLTQDRWDSMAIVNEGAMSPRAAHGAAMAGDSLLVFGGEGGFGFDTLLQDYGILDLSARNWRIDFMPIERTSSLRAAGFAGEVFAYGGKRPGPGVTPAPSDLLWRYDVASSVWSKTDAHLPGARIWPASAGDLEGGRLIVYGGTPILGGLPVDSSNFRYTISTDSWRSTQAPGPPPLTQAVMVYDSLDNRMLVWGGRDGSGGRPTDLWEFSLGALRWRVVPVRGTPPAGRTGHAMILDAPRHRLVLFGGSVSGVGTAETWQGAW